MRAYVTVCFGHYDLLSYFIAYYSRIGVNEFVLLTYDSNDEREHYVRLAFHDLCDINKVSAVDGPRYRSEEFHHGHRQRRVKELHNEYKGERWAVHADLDEFVQLPDYAKTLQDVIAKSPTPIICGIWLDRVAVGGELKPIDPMRLLEEQYPMSARVRHKMGMNQDVVVCSSYAPTSHHPRNSSHWKKSIKLWVHHFKWQGNFVERMQIRSKSKYVKGAHKRRVSKMANVLGKGIPKEWLKVCGNILGI